MTTSRAHYYGPSTENGTPSYEVENGKLGDYNVTYSPPENPPRSEAIPQGEWGCWLIEANAGGEYGTFRFAVNDKNLFELNNPNQWEIGNVPSNWLLDKMRYLFIGRDADMNSGEVWIDDIVISTKELTCGT
jgi:hypothetical protein